MKRFRNILAYVDVAAEKQQALERATRLARENGAKLTVVTSVQEPPWWVERLLPDVANHVYSDLGQQSAEKLDSLVANHTDGIDAEVRTLTGPAWMQVVREVLAGGHDLLVKDLEHAKSLSPDFDMKLLRKCPCPVWLVNRRADRFRRVAAAIDVTPHDDQQASLNEKVLDLAHSLAAKEHGELHVVCAWSVFGESVLRFKMSDAELDDLKQQNQQAIQQLLADFLKDRPFDDVELHTQMVEGEPEVVIPAVVEHESEDLLVMGTLARTGVAGLVIGNTAEKILSSVHCSVLAIKPDGFISPVLAE